MVSLVKKVLIFVTLFFCIGIGLGVGLGVGLSSRNNQKTVGSSELWIPSTGSTWDYHLAEEVDEIEDEIEVYDIDLFDNSEEIVQKLHDADKKVICYFSGGSYEDWRDDSTEFEESDLGESLDGWEGERWVNISSANVRLIMKKRIELASTKGCDAVDPDNVDGYSNTNGLNLSRNDSINFINYLSQIAHNLNMSIGLKNANAIVEDVIDMVEFSVQEQCVKYEECDDFHAFNDAGKVVFHIEYPKGDDVNTDDNVDSSTYTKYCGDKSSSEFSSILKNMNLDSWIQICE